MSKDNTPEESEKLTESGLKNAAGSDATIASPKEQKTWHQSQEAHYIPEHESATHLALRPEQLNDLKAQGLAEKFEIVGFEDIGAEAAKGAKLFGPLENILKEGSVSDDFLQKLKLGLNEIPINERIILERAGVRIKAIDLVPGHEGSGSPSVYRPELKEVLIGMTGFVQAKKDRVETHQIQGQLALQNEDVTGSLKHEIGHALYYALNIENWLDFQKTANKEKLKLDEETKVQLRHILESDREIFAETYALARGRNTKRAEWLKFGFPETFELVKKMLNDQTESKTQ